MELPFSILPLRTIDLLYTGDCSILGVMPDGAVYAEEMYGDDGWLAQHEIDPSGQVVRTVDERSGSALPIQPLDVPESAKVPARGWHTMPLNYAGPRHRGLRGLERVDELVQTLSIPDKIALIARLRLSIPPPMLIGLAESYVLSEAEILHPDWFIVCRRVRFAHALPERQTDADGQPYDYDTRPLYIAHAVNRADDETTPRTGIFEPISPELHRPLDCVISGSRLYISDGGDSATGRTSKIHIWTLQRPDPPSPEDEWHKKLYG
ncbi:MAG: hypothetical protein SF162_15315 [bacterium]|nr:hypothetical protein [bacterium]